ncbi:MAG: GTPase Era [Candidatus Promineifilaceae bacterium]|nr:GTPase Era [Candidatus Promineifilaceae bacterium]
MIDENTVPEDFKSGFVALVGRPNVGKSTLMNALLQQKIAIVTPRPQTTRTKQLGIITEADYQMIFIDTPGMIKSARHKLDEYMLETAEDTFTDADVVLWLVDVTDWPGAEDKSIAAKLQAAGDRAQIILGMNKVDKLAADQVLPHSNAFRELLPNADWILFSALTQKGLPELLQMLVDALPQGPLYYPPDQVTDVFLRDIAAEMIREQIMLQLREEIPYGAAVQVVDFKERSNGTTYISANIFVERSSHKRIIIGHKGKQLQSIGKAAREEIETMLEGKVFLELWVKVQPKWRRDEDALRRFGYSSG